MKKIGKILRLLREVREQSVKDFAKEVGCIPTYICDVESNRKNLSYDMLERFSKVNNVPCWEIIKLEEELIKNNWSHVQTVIEVAKTYQKYNE